MILKVADALISFSRTDPECIARRDPGVIFPAACCELYKIFDKCIPRKLCSEVVDLLNLNQESWKSENTLKQI